MEKIISLVEDAFKAKRTSGAASQKFIEAQSAVFAEIDRSYEPGAAVTISVKESETLGGNIGIVISKKVLKPADYCSYVLTKLPPDPLLNDEKA